jgi:hypothetical protein
MTLILTVANSRGVYQSSDYRLNNPTTGALVSNIAGLKQLSGSFTGLRVNAEVRLGWRAPRWNARLVAGSLFS